MSDYVTNLNPLGWAQYRMLCSPKRHLQVAIVFPLIVVAIASLIYRGVQPLALNNFMPGMQIALLILQGVLLMVGGPSAIRRAVQRDYATGMTDSHRLMPVSSHGIVFGYLTGPSAQILILAVETFLIGLICCHFTGPKAYGAWAAIHIFLVCATLFVWTASVLSAIGTAGKANLVGIAIAIGVLGGWGLVLVLPGMAMFLGIFNFRFLSRVAMGGTPPTETVYALPFQLAFAATFFLAAARKVRRADVQAFNWPLGMLLFLEAALLLLLGLLKREDFANRGFDISARGWFPVMASSLVLCIVALIPIGAAAQAEARWTRRRALDPLTVDRRPIPYLVAALPILALLVVTTTWGAYPYDLEVTTSPRTWFHAGLVLAVGVLAMAGFARRLYARNDRAFLGTLVYFCVLWLAPIATEFVAIAYFDLANETTRKSTIYYPTVISALSPLGAAYALAMNVRSNIWPGLVFQAAVALFFVVRRPRRHARTSA